MTEQPISWDPGGALQETELFFNKVRYDRDFFKFITAQKLKIMNEPYQKRNQVFKLWADRWHIRGPQSMAETVLPHFESHQPGSIHIHVEVDPYEGSVAKYADRIQYLRPLLEVKAKLIRGLRSKVLGNSEWVTRLGASDKNLGPPERVSTLSAVRFEMSHQSPIDVTMCSQFYIEVMSDLIPVIESMIVANSPGEI